MIGHLESLLADVRHALRHLIRTPGFTLAGVVVMALGIGVNLAVFTVADATLFKGFRLVTSQDRIVYLSHRGCCVSYQDLLDWRAEATAFEDLGAVADLRVAVDEGTGAQTATATEVTANTFSILRVQPALGRDFTALDDVPGAARVAILGEAFWRTRFNADPGVLGRVVRINGIPTEIVGVMPREFAFPQRQDLWLPLGSRLAGQSRSARGLWFVVGRLASGVTPARAQSEMDAIAERLAHTYPATNTGVQPIVQGFRELFVGRDAMAVYGALWGAGSLLLAIACANLANLLVARAGARTREVGVCLALGAGRARIIRQQLIGSAVLSGGGGLLGWWLGGILVRAYAALSLPPTQPWAAQLFDYSMDVRAFGYLAAVSVVAGLAVGALPARRLSSLDVTTALRDGARGSAGKRNRRNVAAAAVVTQVALTVMLLSAAGVLVRSFLSVSGRDLGFDPSRVLVTLTVLPTAAYPDVAAQFTFYDRAAAGVRALPGVETLAFSDAGVGASRVTVEADNGASVDPGLRPQARALAISPRYFDTIGASALTGRDFNELDGTPGREAAIVNHRFATLHWGTTDVIGRRLRVFSGDSAGAWSTIVAIAPDLHHGDLARADVEPTVYVPLRQRPARGVWMLARTAVPPHSLAADVRRELQRTDPGVPIWAGPYTLNEWLAGSYWRRGVNGGLFVLFAVMALLLACLGLFAIVAGTVTSRTQEIGVRMAMGASAADVLWLVVRQGLAPAIVGLVIGLAGSLSTNRLLATELVNVAPWDPLTLAAVTGIILFTGLLACLVPARRATRVDPISAIRLE